MSHVQGGQNCERTCKQDRQGYHRDARRNFRSKKIACSAGKRRRDGHEGQRVPWVAVAISERYNKQNHGSQPPIEEAAISSARRDKQTDERDNRENRREAGRRSLSHDIPVPRETFQPNSPGTEKMMRIKSLGDLIGVPIPDGRRQ